MDTDRLIHTLAENVQPVTPLRPPLVRMTVWAAVAVVYLAVLVAVMSPREDLGRRMQEPRFLIEQGAALLTGLSAAVAAFATVVPGYPRRVLWLPLVPLSVWVGTVTVGAVGEYAASGAGVLAWQLDWACVRTILVGASVPGVAMGVMLHRGAPVTPRFSAAFGALAAVGLGNLGVCLFHPHSSDLLLLFWHCGTVLALTALAGATGAQLLKWPASRALLVADSRSSGRPESLP
jgi:hypothetical protein